MELQASETIWTYMTNHILKIPLIDSNSNDAWSMYKEHTRTLLACRHHEQSNFPPLTSSPDYI